MIKLKKISLFILILFLSILSLTCLTDDPLKIPFHGYTPANLGDGWEIGDPAKEGIDGEALKEVYKYVHDEKNVWQIRSLLVFRNNKLIAESYMKDSDDRTNLHPMWSATKGFIGILTGIAMDKGYISIDKTIYDYLPEVSNHLEKSSITIKDLLTMRSGINYRNDGYNGEDGKLFREVPSNSIDFVLALGMHASPGTSFRYKNSDPHLISAIIQETTGKTTRDWAKDVLFDKIGITRLEWRTYKDGVTFGGFGILTTPREMGKIGQLVANDGMWNGEQIVSKNWIDEMTKERINDTPEPFEDVSFCYLWWKDIQRNVVLTMGHGGQYILVNRDKNLVITITSEQHPAFEFSLMPDDLAYIYDRINSITK